MANGREPRCGVSQRPTIPGELAVSGPTSADELDGSMHPGAMPKPVGRRASRASVRPRPFSANSSVPASSRPACATSTTRTPLAPAARGRLHLLLRRPLPAATAHVPGDPDRGPGGGHSPVQRLLRLDHGEPQCTAARRALAALLSRRPVAVGSLAHRGGLRAGSRPGLGHCREVGVIAADSRSAAAGSVSYWTRRIETGDRSPCARDGEVLSNRLAPLSTRIPGRAPRSPP